MSNARLQKILEKTKQQAEQAKAQNLRISHSSIELMMSGQLDKHLLYLELNQTSRGKFDFGDNYGGLGTVFRKESRHRLVSQAFKINDTSGSESIEIADINELMALAKAFKKGNIHGIEQSEYKYILCLALIFNQTADLKLKRKASDELERIYQDTSFKNHKDSAEILLIVDSHHKDIKTVDAATKPVDVVKPPVVAEAKPVVAVKPPVVAEAKPVVAVKPPVVAEAKPAVVVKPPVVAEAKPVVVVKPTNVITLVNALRALLTDEIDTWKNKRTGLFFFGGTTVEHPNSAKKGQFIRVPDGIAKMLTCLKDNSLLLEETSNEKTASDVLQKLCGIAFERSQQGDRANVRCKETNRLYNLLASLTTQFNTNDMAAITKIKADTVTVDSTGITSDYIEKISSLLKYPNQSNVIVLRR